MSINSKSYQSYSIHNHNNSNYCKREGRPGDLHSNDNDKHNPSKSYQ